MKNNLKLLYILSIITMAGFSSCEDDDDTTPEQQVLEVQTAEDIPADPEKTGKYTFYSLADGETVPSADSATTNWDIGLRGTSIIVNGGTSGPGQGVAQVVEQIFEDVMEAPEVGYIADNESVLAIPTGSGNGWYNYTGDAPSGAKNAIFPIPGRIIILKTADGNYAKIEILSYYKGNPDTSTAEFADYSTRPPASYYTFRYILQTDGSRDF